MSAPDTDERVADLLDLLTHVVNGHTRTSRDDVALVQIPTEVFEEIRARVDGP